MGFSLDDVVEGQEAHVAEYTCAICFGLVDAPLLTMCHHVFCTACLQDWVDTKPCCPTCNLELDPRHGAGDLKLASPIAWRVLSRLRVRCPLHKQDCQWVGEYSELMAHMTSSGSHQVNATGDLDGVSAGAQAAAPDVSERQRAAAEGLKEAGNSKFTQRLYADAILLYTKAINAAPEMPVYYTNRAAALFMQGDLDECIADCHRALRLEPSLTKAHVRLAKALCEKGDFAKAALHLRSAGPSLQEALHKAETLCGWQTEGEAAYGLKDYSMARAFFANILQQCNAPSVRLWLVRAELGLGLCDRALRTTRDLIKSDANISKAYSLRGVALFFSADLDQAQKHVREALRLDPDDTEAQHLMKRLRKLERHMDLAKKAALSRDFGVAVSEYTEALSVAEAPAHATISATIHAERAAASVRLKEFDSALKDCALAIYAQDDCKSAWLTKAQALHALGRHKEAMADMEALSRDLFANDPQVKHALQRASFEVRKEQRPNYYELLKVPSVASQLEIKAAYKQRALECHPDKHAHSEEARLAAEQTFKLLGEALEVLGDDFQRKLYNEGYDKAAIAERVQAANRAASSHDKDGCCGGGGCGR